MEKILRMKMSHVANYSIGAREIVAISTGGCGTTKAAAITLRGTVITQRICEFKENDLLTIKIK